jgi:CelD/BcsL family acetyltransferase involved in cellulose biosynthesis
MRHTSLSLTDAPPRSRPVHGPRRFAVDLFDGQDFAAARWPSVAAGPELQMHVFQSQEFLDVWTATIGRARAAQYFLVVVADADGKPVLYLPLAIETRFGGLVLARGATQEHGLEETCLGPEPGRDAAFRGQCDRVPGIPT